MAKYSYQEMEKRKDEGKLFTDTPQALLKATIIKQLVGRFNRSWAINIPKRVIIEKLVFGSFGKSWIEPPFNVCVGKNTSIGNGCYFNFNTTFVDDGKINIGNSVLFGPNVTVITTGHPVHPELREKGTVMYCAPVTIKDGAWICSNAVILPGVTIGENSVVAAGSVVTKDIPDNVIAMGNPCEVVREINDNDRDFYYKDLSIDYGRL